MNTEKIASLIKTLRQKDNLTQNEFAKKYGVTYQAVSKWENGKNLPDVALLKEICSEHNISLDEVLDTQVSKKKNKNLIILISTLVVLTLISALMVSLVTDLKYYYISDRVIVVSSILVALTYLKFLGVNSFLSHILSGTLMFILMYLLKIITTKIFKKESLGDGDIKLMILIGLTLGVFNSFISLFISSVAALIYTILFIKKKDALIPFGPFLLIGAIVTYILVFYQITII